MTKNNVFVSALVALVVGLAVCFLFRGTNTVVKEVPAPVSNVGSISGPVQNVPWNFTQGAGFGGKYVSFSQTISIPAGARSGFWTNKTGRTVYVPRIDASLVGTTSAATVTASSTFALYAYGSTTAPGSTYDYTAPKSSDKMLINNFSFATSSTATTTSSLDKALAGKVVQIPDGQSVFLLLVAPTANCTFGGACEPATSTQRGFNVDAKLDGYYAP